MARRRKRPTGWRYEPERDAYNNLSAEGRLRVKCMLEAAWQHRDCNSPLRKNQWPCPVVEKIEDQ